MMRQWLPIEGSKELDCLQKLVNHASDTSTVLVNLVTVLTNVARNISF